MPDIYSSGGTSKGKEGSAKRSSSKLGTQAEGKPSSSPSGRASSMSHAAPNQKSLVETNAVSSSEIGSRRRRKLVIAQPVNISRLWAETKKIKLLRARVQILKAKASESGSEPRKKPRRKLW